MDTIHRLAQMERLPEMFGVLRPGYDRHEYISLCKNTIQTRKFRGYYGNGRWVESDKECNMIEYMPLRDINSELMHGEYIDSLRGQKKSTVGWKNGRSQSTTETCYHYLPFVLCCNDDIYPVISFRTTGWLPGTIGAIYKLVLTEEEKQSISLELRIVDPSWYDHSMSIPFAWNNEAQEVLQDDAKEPEPIPNKLPIFVIENHMHSEIARSECPIASIGLKECETVSMLGCYHVFDSASIQAWMRIKAECPVCKSKSNIIHTLSVPESLRPQAISLPDEIIEPGSVPAAVLIAAKKIPKPGIAPKKIPKPGIAPASK